MIKKKAFVLTLLAAPIQTSVYDPCELKLKEMYDNELLDNFEIKKSYKKFNKFDQLNQSRNAKGY